MLRTVYALIHDAFVASGKQNNSTLGAKLFGCQLSGLHDGPQPFMVMVANWIAAILGTSLVKGQFT